MRPKAPGLPIVRVVPPSLASASPRRRSRGSDELGRVVHHRGGRTADRVAMRLVHCGRPPESDLHARDGWHPATGSHRPRRNGPTACETAGQGDSEGSDHPEQLSQLWCRQALWQVQIFRLRHRTKAAKLIYPVLEPTPGIEPGTLFLPRISLPALWRPPGNPERNASNYGVVRFGKTSFAARWARIDVQRTRVSQESRAAITG